MKHAPAFHGQGSHGQGSDPLPCPFRASPRCSLGWRMAGMPPVLAIPDVSRGLTPVMASEDM
jgi:hypothetical protein